MKLLRYMGSWSPRNWTLRTRLVVALLVLFTLGLWVVGATSILLLRHQLVSRVDERLAGISRPWREGERLPPSMPSQRPPHESPGRSLPTEFRLLFFDSHYSLVGVTGQVATDPSAPLVPPDMSRICASGRAITVPDSTGGAPWRLRCDAIPDRGEVGVALSLGNTESAVGQLLLIEILVGGVVIVLLGVVAAMLVRLGLRPLTRIEATADAIAGGELDRRVEDQNPATEAGRLGLALNTMLGRLAAAMSQREESEQRLRSFVADASHELRTPLTSIRGFAELYRRGGAEGVADVGSLIGRIEQESVRMGTLVEDLLLLASLDRQRSLDVEKVALEPLADDVVHGARTRAPELEIHWSRTEEPVCVLADAHRLRQVLDNLVTNAVVHTPPETVVRVHIAHGVAGQSAAVASAGAEVPSGTPMGVLEVSDDGPGIDREHATRIFDRFYRVAEGRGRDSGGTGLGLAIATAILEAHGGRVELVTSPGHGATFRVLIPLAEQA